MNDTAASPKRALIFAGGGIKVAFQAGVLQVWLDEAGLEFDLADGASGGCFNLAMWCQGQSGTEIADNWRNLDPKAGVDFNWSQYLKLFYAESLFELGRYRKNVFTSWGLDWERIRASEKEATFNIYNFSRHELAVVPAQQMTEDHLVAAVSLPMWFPPVVMDGETYIDAVFNTDANLEEAIRRGADELWVIWTVSQLGEWNDGFVANYFQVIEAASNGLYKGVLKRIAESNGALEEGRHGEFERHIEVKELKAEVPLHYLVNFSQDRAVEAVNLGVETARAWCRERDIPLAPAAAPAPTAVHRRPTKLSFTEDMKGYAASSAVEPLGEISFEEGLRKGKEDGNFLHAHVTVRIDGVNRFVTQPSHEAEIEGWVRFDPLGDRMSVEKGVFNLFVHADDPRKKRMLYRLFFEDDLGDKYTLSGAKYVEDDPGLDVWSDTTTLFVRIFREHVGPDEEDAEDGAEVVAIGIIRIGMLALLKQLTTFRVEGESLSDRTAALTRFGRLFLGKLWDVYAREILSSGPV